MAVTEVLDPLQRIVTASKYDTQFLIIIIPSIFSRMSQCSKGFRTNLEGHVFSLSIRPSHFEVTRPRLVMHVYIGRVSSMAFKGQM